MTYFEQIQFTVIYAPKNVFIKRYKNLKILLMKSREILWTKDGIQYSLWQINPLSVYYNTS